jgi:hypothetical protein
MRANGLESSKLTPAVRRVSLALPEAPAIPRFLWIGTINRALWRAREDGTRLSRYCSHGAPCR